MLIRKNDAHLDFDLKKWTKLDYSKIKQYKITFKETLEKFKNN